MTRVHMTGSEWFGDRSGGLNRYFESLFLAMKARSEGEVTAQSFGTPPPGGDSWGPVGQNAIARARSLTRAVNLDSEAVLDRHFCLYGQSVGWKRKRPTLVAHFQGPWAGESQVAGGSRLSVAAKYAIERVRHSRADHFVVLSERFKDILTENYGADATRISVLAPGVDLERFRVAANRHSGEALCVRRLERRMGIDHLIKAWLAVHSVQPHAILRIVGTGTDERRLRQLVHDLKLNHCIVFEGAVSDDRLVQLYEASQFTVVPSIALEGFGLIALESLATGTPPIVTDCGGLPDAVKGLDKSLIVPPRDEDALAARIDEALAGKIPSAASCRTHAETFSWDSVAAKHFALYRTLK